MLFNRSSKNAAGTTEERKPNEIWVNVGYLTGKFDENGKEIAICTAVGIPANYLPDLSPTGDKDKVEQRQAQNQLKEDILKLGYELPEGEMKLINLQVFVRRASKVEENKLASPGNAYYKPLALAEETHA